MDSANFHAVWRGKCRLESKDVQEVVGPDDLVFVDPGCDHVMSSPFVASNSAAGNAPTLPLVGYATIGLETETPLAKVFPSLTVIR